ncbi:MAG: LamG domain-containing protein [Paludibacter sp.]
MRKINLFSVLAVTVLFVGVLFTSCKKDEVVVDPYAGKTNPSTIASANLVAYFPLESATGAIESGTGITYSKISGAASYAVGRRGNAYKGSTAAGYLEFNLAAANAFKDMTEYTYSAWLKTPAPTGGAASAFNVNGGDDNMGNLNLVIESQSNADSLALKPYLRNSTTVWQGQDLWTFKKANSTDKWIHVVSTYNKTTSVMALYVNGLLVNSNIKYADGTPAVGPQPLLGALTFVNMTKLTIGAWAKLAAGTALDSWMVYYPGMIDEVRFYNRALTATEAKSLYDAEVTVIN